MKATIDSIVYEGTEEEIRHIVENPPRRPFVRVNQPDDWDYPRSWGDTSTATCPAGTRTNN